MHQQRLKAGEGMRIAKLAHVTPGYITARAVIDECGRVLLSSGVRLTPDHIERLRARGYTRLYVSPPGDPPDILLEEEELGPALRARAYGAVRQVFIALRERIEGARPTSFEDLIRLCQAGTFREVFTARGPLGEIGRVVQDIVAAVRARRLLTGLTTLKSAGAPHTDHSIDTCVVAVGIGQILGLAETRVRQLATGALLHDIGYAGIPPDVEPALRLRQHALLGYELLRAGDDPDGLAPHVAYEHHEHQDGTGVPRGLVGSNTVERNRALPPPIPTLVGEIAAVANLYDQLLSGTLGNEPLAPDMALRVMREVAGTRLNREVVDAFLRVVPPYPLGVEVVVLDGPLARYRALVAHLEPAGLARPLLLLTRDPSGNPVAARELDLSRQPGVNIRCAGL